MLMFRQVQPFRTDSARTAVRHGTLFVTERTFFVDRSISGAGRFRRMNTRASFSASTERTNERTNERTQRWPAARERSETIRQRQPL